MAVFNECRAIGPAHDTCCIFVGGGNSACRMQVADGAVPYIMEGSTAKVARHGDSGFGIFLHDLIRHIVYGQRMALSVEDAGESFSVAGIVIMALANHRLVFSQIDVGSHLGIDVCKAVVNEHGKAFPVVDVA